MRALLHRAADAAADATAALSAAWPRSDAAREVARLVGAGHARGARCEIAFSVHVLDTAGLRAAAERAVRAGFAITETAGATRGFITVAAAARLTPAALARLTRRLERLVARAGADVALIGPAAPPHDVEVARAPVARADRAA